eukprot:1026506-Amphidinium_carterae.2
MQRKVSHVRVVVVVVVVVVQTLRKNARSLCADSVTVTYTWGTCANNESGATDLWQAVSSTTRTLYSPVESRCITMVCHVDEDVGKDKDIEGACRDVDAGKHDDNQVDGTVGNDDGDGNGDDEDTTNPVWSLPGCSLMGSTSTRYPR